MLSVHIDVHVVGSPSRTFSLSLSSSSSNCLTHTNLRRLYHCKQKCKLSLCTPLVSTRHSSDRRYFCFKASICKLVKVADMATIGQDNSFNWCISSKAGRYVGIRSNILFASSIAITETVACIAFSK